VIRAPRSAFVGGQSKGREKKDDCAADLHDYWVERGYGKRVSTGVEKLMMV
jgi:hypothetical protein